MHTYSTDPAEKPLSHPSFLPPDLTSHPRDRKMPEMHFPSLSVPRIWTRDVGAEGKSATKDSSEIECSYP